MSSYEGRLVKIGGVSTRFISKTKSVIPNFLAFLTQVTQQKYEKNLCCRGFLRERP